MRTYGRLVGLALLCVLPLTLLGQTATLRGVVRTVEGTPDSVRVLLHETAFTTYTDRSGAFSLNSVPFGAYTLVAYKEGFRVLRQPVQVNSPEIEVHLDLSLNEHLLADVVILESIDSTFSGGHLKAVDGSGIYAGKKNEVIFLETLNANLSTNNARQAFSRVPGLNIWESDGAGLQMGIAARGLSPNRTANFNTRQNGYDISADALGYPESYYTPPMEALDRIELVRGAASLQYGTQFGGMLNFVFKKGPADKPIRVTSRQSFGSYGYFSTFNSLSGKVGKTEYYAFHQFKRGDGWRQNAQFDVHTAYASVSRTIGKRLRVTAEYTYMWYKAQQPGGLTDAEFRRDAQVSIRNRNWFGVNWNVGALVLDYQIGPRTRLNVRNFVVGAQRQALGNLAPINTLDMGGPRTLIDGRYLNFGNETRLIHNYDVFHRPSTLLVGMRLYSGSTQTRQGDAGSGSGPDFSFLHPEAPDNSSYQFPSKNYALFAENVFQLSSRLSVTPGVRVEHIRTFSDGYYNTRVFDGAGNLVAEQRNNEARSRVRSFVLMGLGVQYKVGRVTELYANFSQNYRAITFSDMRISNPNMKVSPDLHDERGYNIDLGWRGHLREILYFDVSVYYLRYNDRIGYVLRSNEPPYYVPYRLRMNVADSRTYGFEGFAEVEWLRLLTGRKRAVALTTFGNLALTDGRYIHAQDKSVEGRQVELVPNVLAKGGATAKWKSWSLSTQYSWTGRQFSDATNAEFASSAVIGVVPAYGVADATLSYKWRWFTGSASVNNFLDARYFSRRADSYPGPGIIPADGRCFYFTLECKI